MNGNELLDKMDLIKDEYIEAADKEQSISRRIKWQPIAAAACMIIAISTFITISYLDKGTNDNNDMRVAQNDITTTVKQNDITTIVKQFERTTEEMNEEKDLSPVKYSEINLCQAEDTDYGNVSNGYEFDIIAFQESLLERCKESGAIIEGTVTNIYTKEYKYDVYDDKFEENGVLHNFENTVVYEVKIAKVWYGDYKEETILIEDYNYFMDPVWELKVGRKYVLPIAYEGEKIYEAYWDDFKDGECERDSEYCSVYPYHEPIEVTLDGDYLVSSNWSTLIEENAREVIMDLDSYESYHKMYMIDCNTFQRQMNKLVKTTINN